MLGVNIRWNKIRIFFLIWKMVYSSSFVMWKTLLSLPNIYRLYSLLFEQSFLTKRLHVVVYLKANSTHNVLILVLCEKSCISIVFNFSWDCSNTQEKWKTWARPCPWPTLNFATLPKHEKCQINAKILRKTKAISRKLTHIVIGKIRKNWNWNGKIWHFFRV